MAHRTDVENNTFTKWPNAKLKYEDIIIAFGAECSVKLI